MGSATSHQLEDPPNAGLKPLLVNDGQQEQQHHHHHHHKEEEEFVEQLVAGTTTNSSSGGGNGDQVDLEAQQPPAEGNATEHDTWEARKAQLGCDSSRTSSNGRRGGGRGGDDELSEATPLGVRIALRFAGVPPVPSWCSLWMFFRIFWPWSLVTLLAGAMQNLLDFSDDIVRVTTPAVLLGNMTALGCYWWLWPKAKKLLFEEALLPPDQLKAVVRWSGAFTVVWMVYSLAVYAALMISEPGFDNNVIFGGVEQRRLEWGAYIAMVPILSATLLVLGIEMKHAANSVEGLLQAAHDQTLTRDMYTRARDRIRKRSRSWKWSLGLLALVALYCTIGLVYCFHIFASSHDATALSFLENVIWLGKEATLFFVILILTVRVNDSADAITTVLNHRPWGEPGSREESIRQDLLMLTTCSSVTPEAATSMWRRVAVAKSEPISFKVCGLRPTGDLAVAMAISFATSIAAALLRAATGWR